MSSEMVYYMPPESAQVEHKESKAGLSNDIWETYSAFANTKGGAIYLGVKESKKEPDQNKRFYVVGVDEVDKLIHDLTTILNNPNKVSHNVVRNEDIEVLKFGAMQVIKIYVREIDDKEKPLYLNNVIDTAYIRNQTSDIRIKIEELKALIRASREVLDTEILTHYELKHLSV